MSVAEPIAPGHLAGEHFVQFFDAEESRAHSVAAYLARGYFAHQPVLVVAQGRHWIEISQHLQASGVPVQPAVAAGRLVVKDAAETLRKVTRNGSPDAAAFEAIIGGPVAALQTRGLPVCVYGEMVDMLAQVGDLSDAIKLERLWNGLAPRVPFSLMCGYSAAHFVQASAHRALLEICATHSRVHRHSSDTLASWLLDSVQPAAVGPHPLEI
jgi:MEDS: MEthanogen/methylotroph, DcmR Sensory domain